MTTWYGTEYIINNFNIIYNVLKCLVNSILKQELQLNFDRSNSKGPCKFVRQIGSSSDPSERNLNVIDLYN